MKIHKRVIVAFGIGGAALLALTGCTSRTPIDQAELVYHGGLHAKNFKHCIAAGGSGSVGANDTTVRYPVNSRDFQFQDDTAGAERGHINVLAKGGQQMTVQGAVYFTLNDKCDILQKFHEQIGTNYGPSGDGLPTKWNDLLAKYIGVPVENALDRVSLDYTMDDLIGNAAKKNAWQDAASKQIAESIKAVTGGEPYFCKPNYKPGGKDDCGQFSIQLNQAQPPQQVTEANADAAAAAKRNESQTKTSETQAGLIKIFGIQGYLELQRQQLMRDALNKGNIPFLPIPAGGSINYTAPQ